MLKIFNFSGTGSTKKTQHLTKNIKFQAGTDDCTHCFRKMRHFYRGHASDELETLWHPSKNFVLLIFFGILKSKTKSKLFRLKSIKKVKIVRRHLKK